MAAKSIDLHPDKVPGNGPEAALMACRQFLDKALSAGHREVRIITGLGLRGDGSPRLRSRVEAEVLSAYYSQIESQAYEQGGAVIRVHLKPGNAVPSAAYKRQRRQDDAHQGSMVKEERLSIAWERLEAAEDALDENDAKRARMKMNQVAREFGWALLDPGCPFDKVESAVKDVRLRLKGLDT